MADEPPSFDELPELTLSLRSFGSHRRDSFEGAAISQEQDRFFAPLLDARRQAAAVGTPAAVVAAFDAPRLRASLDATLRAFAMERCRNRDAARRAFEAELFEIAEPLRVALERLDHYARRVGDRDAETRGIEWTEWLSQLRRTFRIADDSWPPLRASLEGKHPDAKRGFPWRRRQPPGDER